MKNPLTSAGIEPATFRFVTQYLNHCATAVPTNKWKATKIKAVKSDINKLSKWVHNKRKEYSRLRLRMWVSSTKRFGDSIHDYKKLPKMWMGWWVAKTGNERKIIAYVDKRKWWTIRIGYFLSFIIQTANSWTTVDVSNVYWTVHHYNSWGIRNQLDVTCDIYYT
jgi:hypothetical protein